MLKVSRVHGNFMEYVHFALFLLFLNELNGGRSWLLHTLEAVLLIARIIHIIDLQRIESPYTYLFLGAALTWLVILILSIFCLFFAFFRV